MPYAVSQDIFLAMAESETIGERIEQRLKALNLSARAASLQATGSDGTIRNILLGKSVNPRGDTLTKLAQVLQVSPQWLLTGEDDSAPPSGSPPARRGELVPAGRRLPSYDLPVDLPVYGTVAGAALGRGAFQLTSDVVDYVRRPYALLNARDAYGMFVEGDSMEPRFEPGDLIFVHPHRKALPGDYVVVQEPDSDNGMPQSFIKRLVRVTPTLLRTRQYNPAANIDFVIRPGLIWHKVMTEKDLYGV